MWLKSTHNEYCLRIRIIITKKADNIVYRYLFHALNNAINSRLIIYISSYKKSSILFSVNSDYLFTSKFLTLKLKVILVVLLAP